MKKVIFKVGDSVNVVNAAILPGNEEGPKLKEGDRMEVKAIVLDSAGNQHLDVGLVSELSYVSSYETKEQLPNGDSIHWCHPSRFELAE